MKRSLLLVVGATLFARSASADEMPPLPPPAPRRAAEWVPASAVPPPEEPRRVAFSVKFQAGPGLEVFGGHTLFGFAGDLGLGLQVRKIGAFHGQFGILRGSSDGLLGATQGSFAATWEFILSRVRLGVGAQVNYLVLERVTRDDAFNIFGGTGRLFLDLDIVQSEFANFVVGTHAGFGGASSSPSVFVFTTGLSLGARLKYP